MEVLTLLQLLILHPDWVVVAVHKLIYGKNLQLPIHRIFQQSQVLHQPLITLPQLFLKLLGIEEDTIDVILAPLFTPML